MPKINLDETAAEGKRRYRYLQRYVDRHGRKRTYLRRAGMIGIPLPEPEQPGFAEAYQAALRQEVESSRRSIKCPKCGRSSSNKYQKCQACGASLPLPRVLTPMDFRVYRTLTNRRPKIGVYLLIHKGKLTYIGSSKNMIDRVAVHRQHGRPFDQAFYISTTEGERMPLEKVLIRDLKPSENHVGKAPIENITV